MRTAKFALIIGIILMAAGTWALTDTQAAGNASWFRWDGLALALFGAGIAAVLSGVGSSIGIGIAGGMATGAMQEKPELFGRFLPLAAAPGTQGIYGIVTAVLILGKLGGTVGIDTGWQLFFAGLPIGFAGLASAIWQGKVCASGVGLVVKDPGQFGKALVMAVLVEFYALLGLLTSILMLGQIK